MFYCGLDEAPKVKWLNKIGADVLSLTHSASGTERNWSTHGFIYSDLRQSQATSTLVTRPVVWITLA